MDPGMHPINLIVQGESGKMCSEKLDVSLGLISRACFRGKDGLGVALMHLQHRRAMSCPGH